MAEIAVPKAAVKVRDGQYAPVAVLRLVCNVVSNQLINHVCIVCGNGLREGVADFLLQRWWQLDIHIPQRAKFQRTGKRVLETQRLGSVRIFRQNGILCSHDFIAPAV